LRTPGDKRIILNYHSLPSKNAAFRWKAVLVFEPGSADGDEAEIEVFDGDGSKVESGILEFAGRRLKVKDGRTSITCGDFAKGKHDPSLWLHRKGRPSSPGVVTFE
jgi:hypothetical protein